VLASFVFFFTLGYGARLLAPVFSKPSAWRLLDIAVGTLMWVIAITLIMDGHT
jgi:L-lysine exporter family protein LysE/ArgO